jgi:hypothetical protein
VGCNVARIYIDNELHSIVEDNWVSPVYHNMGPTHWPYGTVNVCIGTKAGVYVVSILWGGGLPHGPTGWTMIRVPHGDIRIPDVVRLAETLKN